VTSHGSAYSRLRRAIQARNLAIIHATAAELGHVGLWDALGILLVIEARDDERFDAAAVRWAGRLALETPDLTLAELAGALESLHALPDEHAQRSLLALAETRAVRRAPGPPTGALNLLVSAAVRQDAATPITTRRLRARPAVDAFVAAGRVSP
jgi:hypothetical protein